MRLNSDLGEGFDEVDRGLIPLIDMANIACGGHVGDASSMRKCLHLVQANGIECGPHPSYPDREHFGRISLDIAQTELQACLEQQVGDFLELADKCQQKVSYIKPHGALYNDCLSKPNILDTCLALCLKFKLPLMMLAGPKAAQLEIQARALGVSIISEAFADRLYLDDGSLSPRSQVGAVLDDIAAIVAQAESIRSGFVNTAEGHQISIQAQTLCVHGDSPGALNSVKAIRRAFD